MTENLERQIIELIATDRIDVPISSMSGKLKRQKPKIGQAIDLSEYDGNFEGNRVYARVGGEDRMKARGMSAAIEEFAEQYPRHGEILQGMIAEERVVRESHLYFGVNPGCKLTAEDYVGVMQNLGFTEATARSLYPELMNVSRKISRKRDEERSVLIG